MTLYFLAIVLFSGYCFIALNLLIIRPLTLLNLLIVLYVTWLLWNLSRGGSRIFRGGGPGANFL